MNPREFWWLAEFYRRKHASESNLYAGMSEEEVEQIYREAYGPEPFQDAD